MSTITDRNGGEGGGSSGDSYLLRWSNFFGQLTSSFESLRGAEELVDVTIACQGQRLKAHRVILSASSPYFRDLLRDNPCSHPIVLLKGVKFKDLEALVQFMYSGQIHVAQDDLERFLRTADLLQVRGLARGAKGNAETSSATTHRTSVAEDDSSEMDTLEESSAKVNARSSADEKSPSTSQRGTPISHSPTAAAANALAAADNGDRSPSHSSAGSDREESCLEANGTAIDYRSKAGDAGDGGGISGHETKAIANNESQGKVSATGVDERLEASAMGGLSPATGDGRVSPPGGSEPDDAVEEREGGEEVGEDNNGRQDNNSDDDDGCIPAIADSAEDYQISYWQRLRQLREDAMKEEAIDMIKTEDEYCLEMENDNNNHRWNNNNNNEHDQDADGDGGDFRRNSPNVRHHHANSFKPESDDHGGDRPDDIFAQFPSLPKCLTIEASPSSSAAAASGVDFGRRYRSLPADISITVKPSPVADCERDLIPPTFPRGRPKGSFGGAGPRLPAPHQSPLWNSAVSALVGYGNRVDYAGSARSSGGGGGSETSLNHSSPVSHRNQSRRGRQGQSSSYSSVLGGGAGGVGFVAEELDRATAASEIGFSLSKASGGHGALSGGATAAAIVAKSGGGMGPIHCPVCPQVISSRHNLFKHMRVRHGGTELAPCPSCNKVYKNKYSLREHLRMFHRLPPTRPYVRMGAPPTPTTPPNHRPGGGACATSAAGPFQTYTSNEPTHHNEYYDEPSYSPAPNDNYAVHDAL